MKKIVSTLVLASLISMSACDMVEESTSSSSAPSSATSSATSSSSLNSSSSMATLSSSSAQMDSLYMDSDLYEADFAMGGASSSFGSYLDADSMEVYKGTQIGTHGKDIDLVFSGGDLYSPLLSSRLDLTHSATMAKVDVDFDSVMTEEQIDVLYYQYQEEMSDRLTPDLGDVIVFETSDGNHRLIKITDLDADDMYVRGLYK